MARPVIRIITQGLQSWDGDVSANFAIITQSPLPIHQSSTLTALNTNFPPGNYADCIGLVGDQAYYSNGTTWTRYYTADNQADSTATTVAELATDLNSLLSKLQAAGIMATS